MKKIGLNIICQNEAACIAKMLESTQSIIDVIVAVDTGSTDETISIIKKFGFLSNIPTYVFQRPFDNFCNSRNYALDKLHEIVHELAWHPHQAWGLTIDCDETLQVSDKFDKHQLSDDLYLIYGKHNDQRFLKPALFNLSAGVRWKYPVHEIIEIDNKGAIKTSTLPLLHLVHEPKKSTHLQKRYLNDVKLLTEYAETGHNDYLTLYHIGEGHRAAGNYLAAEKYYETAASLMADYQKEKSYIYHDLAQNKLSLGEKWENVQPLFLLSYNHNMLQAESIAPIIRYYISQKHWHLAQIFSSFAYNTYHNNPPELDPSGRSIQISLYQWELLFYHYVCCYATEKTKQAADLRRQLKKYALNHLSNLRLFHILIILYPKLISSFKFPH